MKKYFRRIGSCTATLLIIVGFASIYSLWHSSKTPGKPPTIFGYMSSTVLTGSMEPSLKVGDLLVIKTFNSEEAKVNDIITFKNSNNTLITHRIVDVVDKKNDIFFQIKGDANNISDQDLVPKELVIGSLQFHIPKAGYIVNFIKSPLGLAIVATFLFIAVTIRCFKKFTNYYPEKKEGDDCNTSSF